MAARELAQHYFGGNASSAIQVVVHSADGPVTEGAGKQVLARVTKVLEAEPRIADVLTPQPGATLSPDGQPAVILAGAGTDPNETVRVADDLKVPLQDLSTKDVQVNPIGASLLWSDFNEANLAAMLKSELFSWRRRPRSWCSPSTPRSTSSQPLVAGQLWQRDRRPTMRRNQPLRDRFIVAATRAIATRQVSLALDVARWRRHTVT